jgi:hypothetical protein
VSYASNLISALRQNASGGTVDFGQANPGIRFFENVIPQQAPSSPYIRQPRTPGEFTYNPTILALKGLTQEEVIARREARAEAERAAKAANAVNDFVPGFDSGGGDGGFGSGDAGNSGFGGFAAGADGEASGPGTGASVGTAGGADGEASGPGTGAVGGGDGGGDGNAAGATGEASGPGASDGAAAASGGGGGGGDCFTAETIIRMADGSEKKIVDVAIGDKVLAADGVTANEVAHVERLEKTNWPLLYAPHKGMKPFATINHPLLIDGQYMRAGEDYYPWFKSQRLQNAHVVAADNVPVFNLWVKGDGTFWVNGYATHSIINDGGWARLAIEQGVLPASAVYEIQHRAGHAPVAVRYGLNRLNLLVGWLDFKPLTKAGVKCLKPGWMRNVLIAGAVVVGAIGLALVRLTPSAVRPPRVQRNACEASN